LRALLTRLGIPAEPERLAAMTRALAAAQGGSPRLTLTDAQAAEVRAVVGDLPERLAERARLDGGPPLTGLVKDGRGDGGA